MNVFLVGLTAIMGAVVGAALSYWLPRARPRIIVSAVELAVTAGTSSTPVPVNKGILSRVAEFPLHTEPHEPLSDSEKDYIAYLEGVTEQIDRFQKNELSELATTASRLRGLAASEDFATLRQEFLRAQNIVYPMIEGESQRRTVEVLPKPPRQQLAAEGKTPTKSGGYGRDKKGDLIVEIGGPGFLYFPWTHREGQARDRAKLLATASASAFAHNDKEQPIKLFEFARDGAPDVNDAANILLANIAEELQKYQRLRVTTITANSGRLPYAVSPGARLVVNSTGYPIRALTAGRAERLEVDLVIDLTGQMSKQEEDEWFALLDRRLPSAPRGTWAKSSLHAPSPIAVTKATSVNWFSDLTVDAIPHAQELTALFAGGERRAYMVLSAILPAHKPVRTIYSPAFPFSRQDPDATLPLK